MTSSEESIQAVFFALSDSTRRQVMNSLSEGGPATASELAARLPVTRQAIAKHLAALTEAGLATGERTGREKRYHLTPSPFSDAMAWMTEVGGRWDERLDALKRHLEDPSGEP